VIRTDLAAATFFAVADVCPAAFGVGSPLNRCVDHVLSDGPPTYSVVFKPSSKRIL
jgi:hypothetical protein